MLRTNAQASFMVAAAPPWLPSPPLRITRPSPGEGRGGDTLPARGHLHVSALPLLPGKRLCLSHRPQEAAWGQPGCCCCITPTGQEARSILCLADQESGATPGPSHFTLFHPTPSNTRTPSQQLLGLPVSIIRLSRL